jgi:hypothetical protein
VEFQALNGRQLAGVVLAVVVLGGCSVQIRTGPQDVQACDGALIAGKLARSGETGAGLLDGEGVVQSVTWPFGFSARIGVSGLELLDAAGTYVAREGDVISAGGGSDGQGSFVICSKESIAVERQID